MYFFHRHNIVGCLASIGDSDKMIHIPKEVHLSFSLSIVPNDLYGRFFCRHSFCFATSPVRNHCNNRSFARSDFQLPRKKSS